MGIYRKLGNWFVDFRHKGKRYRQKIGPYKRQAEIALQKYKVAIAENKFLDMKPKFTVTFQDMTKDYLEKYSKLNKRSYTRDISTMKHLLAFFGGKRISDISSLRIEEYKALLLSQGCANCVNRSK